jgi:hypothetical protein
LDLVLAAGEVVGRPRDQLVLPDEPATPLDVPDSRFTGPF